jgi:putative ABC transport system permease protein
MPDSPKTAGESACPTQPPRLAESLLRWLVGGRDADAVSGDLREAFAARGGGRLWYWGQALSCIAVRLSPHRRMLPGLGKDFQYALRTMRRNPGYALTAVLCLALAMGANTTLFSLLDSMYFRRLPVPEAGRMVRINREPAMFSTWHDFREVAGLRSMEAAGVRVAGGYVDIGRTNLRLALETVSANYAQVLRIGASRGRWFAPENDSPASPPAAVISYRLWREQLHGDPDILGKQVLFDEQSYSVIGVAPPGFRGVIPPLTVDLWVPVASIRDSQGWVNLVGRLAPGATLASAAAELRVVDARLRAADPGNPRLAGAARVEPAAGFAWKNGRRELLSVLALMGGVCGVVLLIACVNVANLLLSRAAVRRREMALRQSLGAGRARLFREALVEGLVLAAGGVALGLLAGYGAGRALEWALPSIPAAAFQGIQFGIDWSVALLLGALGAASAILFSLPPALSNSHRDLSQALKDESAIEGSRQRELYTLAQVALSLPLLIASGLLLRTLQHVERADPGFATADRLTINVFASPKAWPREAAGRLFTQLIGQARAVPGVIDTTLALAPLGPAPGGCASPSALAPPRHIAFNIVEPNYFESMRVPIARGAGFAHDGSPGVVINETLGRAWWPGEDPLGKMLWLGCDRATRQITPVLGVVRATKWALDTSPEPCYYVSRLQDPGKGAFALIVHTAGNPYQWAKPLLQILERAGPNLRIYEVQSLQDSLALTFWEVRWRAGLLASLGLLAVVLAAIGLYGVVAYAVSQRTREIGVRMALGAAPGDVQWMVLARGLRITGLGIACGLLLSAATVRLLRSFLYGVSPYDPAAFVAASIAWLIVATLASWYPARRATRVDPLTALKYE